MRIHIHSMDGTLSIRGKDLALECNTSYVGLEPKDSNLKVEMAHGLHSRVSGFSISGSEGRYVVSYCVTDGFTSIAVYALCHEDIKPLKQLLCYTHLDGYHLYHTSDYFEVSNINLIAEFF